MSSTRTRRGVPRGELTLIVGAPSIGVSGLLHSLMLEAAAKSDTPAAWVLAPLGHGPIRATRRLMTILSRVDVTLPHNGAASKPLDERLRDAVNELAAIPVRIWDAPRDLGRFRSDATQIARAGPLDVLAIDDVLQLRPAAYRRMEPARWASTVYAALKELAIALDVAIVAGHAMDPIEGDFPAYADLGELDAIEEHAAAVVIVHRPMYYCREESELPEWALGPADARFIVPWTRYGMVGEARARWDAQQLRFVPLRQGSTR